MYSFAAPIPRQIKKCYTFSFYLIGMRSSVELLQIFDLSQAEPGFAMPYLCIDRCQYIDIEPNECEDWLCIYLMRTCLLLN